MTSWQPTNPVERRLVAAHQDWLRFAQDKAARVLYWQTSEADLELIKLYFQTQQELSCAVLTLTASFESGEQYAPALSEEILRFYDARRQGSLEHGIAADWTPPSAQAQEGGNQYLLEMLGSLMQHHPEVFPGLVLILMPEKIRDMKAFERWLDSVLSDGQTYSWISERIRYVQYGVEAKPLPWLNRQRPHQVKVIRGEYRMKAVPRELVAQSGERGPGGQFRRLFAELSETLSHDDPARLERLRDASLAVTQEHRWFDQSAVVHLLTGAAYLKWQSPTQALGAYQLATQAGQKALADAQPAGNRLVVNGLFGEASVHLGERDYMDAARCYEQAAAFAEADHDGILTVESWRMQAYCLARAHRQEAALDAGFRALDAGEWVDQAMRANSNLQLVAKWMLGQVGFLHKRRGELILRLEALYGEDWPRTIESLPAEAVSEQLMAAASQGDA